MSLAETGLPKTVPEAVDQLLAALSPEEKELIRKTAEEDLIELHFGLGAGIMETFQLWQGTGVGKLMFDFTVRCVILASAGSVPAVK